MRALDPAFEPFDNEISAHILFTKVTGRISPNQEFSAFFNKDATPYESNNLFSGGRFVKTIIGGKGVAARLNSVWNDQLTSRIAFSWNDKSADTQLLNPGVLSRPVFRTAFPSAGILVGSTQRTTLDNVSATTQSPYTKWTLTGDLTWYKSGWRGSHEFQLGLFLQPRMTRLDTITHANDECPRVLIKLVRAITKEGSMSRAKAYSAASATSPLALTTIPRRDPTERDVRLEIL